MVWPALIGMAGALGAQYITDKNRNKYYNENVVNQERFAKQGIQWKVADAKAAGLHPLAALGAQTTSFKPIHVGLDSGVSGFGQNISRAISSTMSSVQKQIAAEQLANMRLQNKYQKLVNMQKAKEIAVGPGLGKGNIASIPGQGVPVGATRIENFGMGVDGTFTEGLTQEGSERFESDFWPRVQRFLSKGLKSAQGIRDPERYLLERKHLLPDLPNTMMWKFSPWLGEIKPVWRKNGRPVQLKHVPYLKKRRGVDHKITHGTRPGPYPN